MTDDEKVTTEDFTDEEKVILASDDKDITDWGRLDDFSDNEPEAVTAEPEVIEWDPKNTTVLANTRPRKYMSTRYNSAIKAANKIKNKYRKKIIGKETNDILSDDNNRFTKTSTGWLKSAGYLDAKVQDAIS